MRVLALAAFLFCGGLCGAAAPVTIAEAREITADAVSFLQELHESAADAQFHTGKWEECIASLERVIQLDPRGIEPYANAAWLLFSLQRKPEAETYYHRMLDANPTNPEGYFVYGFYYYNQRQYAEALPLIQKAVELGIGSPQRHMLGHALSRLGRTEEAIAFWERMAKDEPDSDIPPRELDKLRNPKPAPAEPAPAQ